jgi:hypothetical protein
MAEIVYIVGTLTCLLCTVLLGRSYLRSRTRLLFWSSICFVFLAANNVLLLIDLYVIPVAVSLALARTATALAGFLALLLGLLWDAR